MSSRKVSVAQAQSPTGALSDSDLDATIETLEGTDDGGINVAASAESPRGEPSLGGTFPSCAS